MTVPVHPLVSPWGRFTLTTYLIDAPEPAIVDSGVASSPESGIRPALEALGRRVEDVRWILLTHGHIDHVGGAHALWELTGRKAEVVIGAEDASFVRTRQAHVDEALRLRGPYVHDPGLAARKAADAAEAISGELEPTRLVRDGDELSLGGDVRVGVVDMAGHTPGAVAYTLGDAAFVGDSVQGYGAASGFPGYPDPDRYRANLLRLRDEVRPRRVYLGHPYRGADGEPWPAEHGAVDAGLAIGDSLEHEARIRAAAERYVAEGVLETDSAYSPFERLAAELGYTGDPTVEPAPFFTTLGGYRTLFSRTPRVE